ncbi:MAG: PDZ domain-containing protein [Candidatus Pacebacteria bacterium]|nr:PDZ domain-containing protein [Candidatus Paceibacterota bacterium]
MVVLFRKTKKSIIGIILIISVSSLLLFYWWQGSQDHTNLLNNFQNDKQNYVSSFEKFQNDRSIDREGKDEAGSLMKTVIDKIFASEGFQIEARALVGKDICVSDIASKGDISFSFPKGHFYIKGVSGISDIYSDKEDIVVAEVLSDTPAEKAGVKYKDQIIAIDNEKMDNASDFVDYIQSKENILVSLLIKRDDKEITLSVIPEKIYDEKVGIGIKFWEMKDYIDMEVIIYKDKAYDKYGSKFLVRDCDADEFDSPCLDETLQWSNPMHYINYLRFYKNPKIIETTESEIKITFDVDLKYFILADRDYKKISQIKGEISLDKDNFNPIQERLEIVFDNYEKGAMDITVDFINFDKVIKIVPPDANEIVEIW